MNSFFFLHLLYIGLFLFSNKGRGVSFVTDGIVDSVFDELIRFFCNSRLIVNRILIEVL